MYARREKAAAEARRWRGFVSENRDLLASVGFPPRLLERKSVFDHWLMRGVHPDDPSGFEARALGPVQRAALVEAIDAYLAEGFEDPGIALLTEAEGRRLTRATSLIANRRRRSDA